MAKVLAIFLVVSLCYGCDSGTQYRFSNYEAAKADKTVIGASLPEFLPLSAREIVGWYRLEMREQTTEFSFSLSDRVGMLSSFSPAGNLGATCTSSGLHSWSWSNIHKEDKFEFYARKANDGTTECLSVDIEKGRAYYWIARRG